jgi:predicted nucleotide-binding protein (sugar kinase/HSP70/actin superfamily)
MGSLGVLAEAFLSRCGQEVILPPPTSKKTLTLGSRYAPEFACLPLKVTLGNLIEALEKGADTIAMLAASGPCRFGYYATLQDLILTHLGYKYELITLDYDMLGNVRKLKRLAGGKHWFRIGEALRFGFLKLLALEKIERLSHRIRPYEIKKGSTTKAYRTGYRTIGQSFSFRELSRAKKEAISLLEQVPQDRSRRPLKVTVVGETFTVLEPYTNLEIEIKLGEMGCEVYRSVWATEYMISMLPIFQRWGTRRKYRKVAKPYLAAEAGGESIVSVASSIIAARKGFAGVVHIAPFTCLPEVIAQGILTKVRKDFNIPILTLVLDEHTAQAGLITRLEAFVDLLERKKASRASDTRPPAGGL